MSRADGLYTRSRSVWFPRCLRLAASDNKKSIVRAFELAEKITPANHKDELRYVLDKVRADHPALNIARHVCHDLNPAARDRLRAVFRLQRSASRLREAHQDSPPKPAYRRRSSSS